MEFDADECILDLSILPDISSLTGFKQVWVPDVIRDLLLPGAKGLERMFQFSRLHNYWTSRPLDIESVVKSVTDSSFGDTRLAYLSEADVDPELFHHVYEDMRSSSFEVSFSPTRDVLAEYAAKTVAALKKKKIPVLAAGRRLATELRGSVTIVDLDLRKATHLVKAKQRYIDRHFAGVRASRGVRYFICLGMTLVTAPLPETISVPLIPVEFALGLVDP